MSNDRAPATLFGRHGQAGTDSRSLGYRIQPQSAVIQTDAPAFSWLQPLVARSRVTLEPVNAAAPWLV
jgi:hypothetical protein